MFHPYRELRIFPRQVGGTGGHKVNCRCDGNMGLLVNSAFIRCWVYRSNQSINQIKRSHGIITYITSYVIFASSRYAVLVVVVVEVVG